MKKIIWTGTNKVEIVNEEIPVPAPGQAVIKIKYAGICGSDLHVFSGKHPLAQPPMVLGHEAVGTLYAINSDRADVTVGDIVCTHTVEPCHACEDASGRQSPAIGCFPALLAPVSAGTKRCLVHCVHPLIF